MTHSLIQVSGFTLEQLIKQGKERKREEKEGGMERGRMPPKPVSQTQRGRTTSHNRALQRLAESCNLA